MMRGDVPAGIHTAIRNPRPLSALSSWRSLPCSSRAAAASPPGRAFKPGVLTVATGFVPAPGDRAIAATAEWVAG